MASDSIIIAIGVAQDTIIIAIHWSFHHVVNQLSYHYQLITHIVTVRVHEQQERHSSTSCHRRLLTLVQICKSLWPKWEDGGARNKPGKKYILDISKIKWNVMYFFKEAPSSADSILLSGRLESIRVHRCWQPSPPSTLRVFHSHSVWWGLDPHAYCIFNPPLHFNMF